MAIKLYNTLTKQKELFKPIKDGVVGMYNCGPTVYDKLHIGNFRSYVFADLLRRTFEMNKYKVKQVVNITDFGHLTSDEDEGEDKMSKGLRREGLPFTMEAMFKLGTKYINQFKVDAQKLNIQKPHSLPRASKHIKEQIELIKTLEKKGYTYTTTDGVYFDTSKKGDYGKLSGSERKSQKEGARVAINPEKHNPSDFAVWKFSAPAGTKYPQGAEKILGWDSPWGKGFPGWHIECSAMNMKYLGEHFDIHTGGIDHIPVHHENEIAQSESATGRPYVNYWMHNGHVLVGDGKMAKSQQNFITLDTLVQKGYSPLAYRYWLLTADYKKTINFTWDALSGAQEALSTLYSHVHSAKRELTWWESLFSQKPNTEYVNRFCKTINDDLNMPQAVVILWDLAKNSSLSSSEKYATMLVFDTVLGLGFRDYKPTKPPRDIQELVKKREEARRNKDWEAADALRQDIQNAGFQVLDTPSGAHVEKQR